MGSNQGTLHVNEVLLLDLRSFYVLYPVIFQALSINARK